MLFQVTTTFREKKIPCDVVWMDIDYMQDFKCFTFDKVLCNVKYKRIQRDELNRSVDKSSVLMYKLFFKILQLLEQLVTLNFFLFICRMPFQILRNSQMNCTVKASRVFGCLTLGSRLRRVILLMIPDVRKMYGYRLRMENLMSVCMTFTSMRSINLPSVLLCDSCFFIYAIPCCILKT